MPPSRKTDHAIKLTPGARPPARRIYRMSPKEELVLKETLDDLLAKGCTEPAN